MKDSNFLRENNARHLWHPMGHPETVMNNPPNIISKAEGSTITDYEGNTVVDGVGGLWCVNVGYSCDPIKQAIIKQMDQLPYYSSFAGSTNEPAIELSYELCQMFSEEDMGRCFFTSGGSDSVETSLRLARQYHKINGHHGRTKFLSLKKGYHGTHFGGASVNGNSRFRTNYEPLLPGCYHIPSPYTYRNPFNENDPERLADLCVAAAADEIEFQGPDTIAAFIMEPIQGAGGVIVPHQSFMKKMRDLCTKHGILMIADEVITGFGRIGDWCGSRHWGVKPDMMTMAKGITSAYFPFGVCMVSENIAKRFEQGDSVTGNIGHGYTYSAHPVGAAAALACIKESRRLNIQTSAKARGEQLYKGLEKLKEKYTFIGDVRGGHGLMAGIELVSDVENKTPMGSENMNKISAKIFKSGAMVRVGGHNILMSPPCIITEEEVSQVLNALDKGFSIL